MSSGRLLRWMYRSGRPNAVAKLLNGFSAVLHRLGVAPNYLVTLEVVGRSSGRTISLPLVMAVLKGRRYLVSMLGDEVAWVRNVRAANGNAVIVHGKREPIHLEEVPVEQRAPIIQLFLQRAPGARPHIPVDKDSPVEQFAEIAAKYPVFEVKAGD
jgi:hypothetical protein